MIYITNEGGRTCAKPADFPDSRGAGVSLRTAEGNPLFCGEGGLNDLGRECKEYDPAAGEWSDGPDMLEERISASSVELANGTFWVLGSYVYPEKYTSELYQEGGFVQGPELPHDNADIVGCAAHVTDSVTFYAKYASYLYDGDGGEFVRTSDSMPEDADHAFCGTITREDGSKMVVVAGGYDHPYTRTSTQLYDLNTGREYTDDI